MESYMQSGLLVEINDRQNVEYILKNNKEFVAIHFKVLKNNTEKSSFVNCVKELYNGQIKLIYFTDEYRSLESVVPYVSDAIFFQIVADLFRKVLDVKKNGFLHCENINLSLNRIFIDPKTYTVRLIYLPLSSMTLENKFWETEFRSGLVKLIQMTPALGEKGTELSRLLASGVTKLDDIEQYVRRMIGEEPRTGDPRKRESIQPQLIFTSVQAVNPIEFRVNKAEFIIGKNRQEVDGVITFNGAISNVHCCIVYENNQYYIRDGKNKPSTNGTFVNHKQVKFGELVPLHNGDKIRLANSNFTIKI